MSYNEQLGRYFDRMRDLGMPWEVANAIRRDAVRLNTISERECNGTLERIEEEGRTDHNGRPLKVGKVYVVWGMDRPGPICYAQTRDMETPARDRIEKAAAAHGFAVEYQGDPRGLPVCLKKDGREVWPPVRG